ncbi:MAG: 2-oxo acid dehydrogenase subunit E2 [Clostridiales bacterium]|nr:2-oxo acid dehydrogenase subunit E2 [Clostridiales bacterium]
MNDPQQPGRLTPLARRIAAEKGLDARAMQGSGYGGRVYSYDLRDAPASVPSSASFPADVNPMGQVLGAYADTEPLSLDAFEVSPVPCREKLIEFPRPRAAHGNEGAAVGGRPQACGAPVVVDAAHGSGMISDGAAQMAPAPVKIQIPAQEQAPVQAQARMPAPAPAMSTEAMVAAVRSADDEVAGVLRMNEARQSVAAQASRSSRETASVTQHMEMDITEMLALHKRMNENREKPVTLPLAAFYLKAMGISIKDAGRLRLRLAETQDAFLMMEGANIGLQVDAGDRVVTPVVRDADLKTLSELAADITALAEKARRGDLTERDLSGGAITLLDKGDSDVYAFTPIINQPEAAILGIGTIYKKLVMTEKGIENRQFIMQSLTFDHRILNGSEADSFQRRLKAVLEDPLSLVV